MVMLKEIFLKGKVYPSRLGFSLLSQLIPPAERAFMPGSVAAESQCPFEAKGGSRLTEAHGACPCLEC